MNQLSISKDSKNYPSDDTLLPKNIVMLLN